MTVARPPSPTPTARPSLRVVATADLPGNSGSTDIAIDPSRDHVYVLSADGLLVVLDTRTTTSVTTLSVGQFAEGMTVDPVAGRIYVYFTRVSASSAGGSLSVIDGQTNTIVATIEPGVPGSFGAGIISVNPNTSCVYVGDFSSKVAVVDGATNTMLGSLAVGGQPAGVAVDVPANRVFVLVRGLTSSIAVIDGLTNAIVDRFASGENPRAIAANPVTGRIYVTSGPGNGDGTLTVRDGATGSILKTLPVMNRPEEIAVDPIANRIYVANVGSDTVSVIDGARDEIVATAIVAHAMGLGIAVDPRTGRIYVVEQIRQPRSLQVLE